MDIRKNWKLIKKTFEKSHASSFHYAVATSNKDGSPHITPIGALFLRDNLTGFFFDQFPVNMSKNLARDPRVCIMAVQSDTDYWGNALMEGRFHTPPAVRIIGRVGERREATREEIDMWQKKVEFAKGMKGYDILWKEMHHVRDIECDNFEPVFMGEMTRGLWVDGQKTSD
jgi:hypothetical protein